MRERVCGAETPRREGLAGRGLAPRDLYASSRVLQEGSRAITSPDLKLLDSATFSAPLGELLGLPSATPDDVAGRSDRGDVQAHFKVGLMGGSKEWLKRAGRFARVLATLGCQRR